MPDLPTLTLNQAHYDRVVQAFPGATLADKATAYKNWLTNNLIDFVQAAETAVIDQAAAQDKSDKLAALRASLPPKLPFPPT